VGLRVTVPKGLFTLNVNVKIVTAKIFWPPYLVVLGARNFGQTLNLTDKL
jgi:hypothetical protein